jgi:molybdopterin molybdotransferase
MKTITQIALELQGYDPQAISAAGVGVFLNELVSPVLETQAVGLLDALGRVLAVDVVSPISVPPHDNSAMDGFAFRGSALSANADTQLAVVGTALAGKQWQGVVNAGQCVKIMTGAVMPAGLDTVAPQEMVRIDGSRITVPAGALATGDNRRHAGEDLMQGGIALAKGEHLNSASIGLLASLNIAKVQVVRQLKVAYFSTGDEILSLGDTPREGAVYDSNRYTVLGMLRNLGVQVIDMGVVRDDPALLEAAFTDAASKADAIITSGGVSVGEADFTKAMMQKLGDVAFWKIAMRPGRPMAVGRIILGKNDQCHRDMVIVRSENSSNSPGQPASDSEATQSTNAKSAILFGLPGNPVAVMVTFLAFVRPALLRMMGSTEAAPPLLRAISAEAIRKKAGRTEYQRGWVSTLPDGTLSVKTTGNQGSGVLSSMVQANGLIVLHHSQGHVAVGDAVDVMVLKGLI